MELQDYYQKVCHDPKSYGGLGLAAVCLFCLGQKLCKVEQMSNWELRPLRYSMEHYSAMDAWILTQIADSLQQMASKRQNKFELGVEKFIRKVVNSQIVEKAGDEKKPRKEEAKVSEKAKDEPEPASKASKKRSKTKDKKKNKNADGPDETQINSSA